MDSKELKETFLNYNSRCEEVINIKASSDQKITTENDLFHKNDKTSSVSELSEKEKIIQEKKKIKENARLEKWSKIFGNYDNLTKNNFKQIKKETRKGIPDSFRALMWQRFAEIDAFRNDPNLIGIYQKLVNEETSNEEVESEILRDICQAFPKNSKFIEHDGLGQRKLFEVLRAYSKFNKETGYTQGIGFLAALMFTYMDDESSFWMIHSLMIKYQMIGYYYKDFPELKKSFYKLLSLMKKHIPKVYQLLKKMKIHPTMYCSQWFITLFTLSFPFDVLVRFFDVFLLEGTKVIYRFALAVLKLNEVGLLKAKNLEELMETISNLFNNVDAEILFKKAFSFSISHKHLAEFDVEYELFKDNQDNEIVNQISY